MFNRVEPNIDRTFLEPTFAIAKVVFPKPPEFIVKAKLLDFGPVGDKALTPFGKRKSIGMAEMLGLL
jgi:hypothetical protein